MDNNYHAFNEMLVSCEISYIPSISKPIVLEDFCCFKIIQRSICKCCQRWCQGSRHDTLIVRLCIVHYLLFWCKFCDLYNVPKDLLATFGHGNGCEKEFASQFTSFSNQIACNWGNTIWWGWKVTWFCTAKLLLCFRKLNKHRIVVVMIK